MSEDKLLQYLARRMDILEKKIDALVAFKWQLLGATGVFSLILAFAVQLGIAIIKN